MRWSEGWQAWVPDNRAEPSTAVSFEPAAPPVPKHQCSGLECGECWNAGVRYADYLQAKREQF